MQPPHSCFVTPAGPCPVLGPQSGFRPSFSLPLAFAKASPSGSGLAPDPLPHPPVHWPLCSPLSHSPEGSNEPMRWTDYEDWGCPLHCCFKARQHPCLHCSFSLLESWVLSAAVDYEFPGATVHVLVSPAFMGNSFSNPPSPLPHVDHAITIQ